MGVVGGVGSVRHRLENFGDGGSTANAFEVALGAEPLQHDRDVDALPRVVQFEKVPIKHLMRLVGKVIGPHNQGDIVTDVRLQQDAAEHRPFGIDVGRAFPRFDGGNRHRSPVSRITVPPPPPLGRPLAG